MQRQGNELRFDEPHVRTYASCWPRVNSKETTRRRRESRGRKVTVCSGVHGCATAFGMYIRSLIFRPALGLPAAELTYQKRPQAVEDVLNALATPNLSISPARTHVILSEPLRYPPIADLAQPMLRLAGLRMNPRNNGSHRGMYATELTLKRLSDGVETVIALPCSAKPGIPRWSPH